MTTIDWLLYTGLMAAIGALLMLMAAPAIERRWPIATKGHRHDLDPDA